MNQRVIRVIAKFQQDLPVTFTQVVYESEETDIDLYLSCTTNDMTVAKCERNIQLSKSFIGRKGVPSGIREYGYAVLPEHPITCATWCYESELERTKQMLLSEIRSSLILSELRAGNAARELSRMLPE